MRVRVECGYCGSLGRWLLHPLVGTSAVVCDRCERGNAIVLTSAQYARSARRPTTLHGQTSAWVS